MGFRQTSTSKDRISTVAGSSPRCSSVAIDGCALYRGVLTHGFTVDAKGLKMSKSLGNGRPQDVAKNWGRYHPPVGLCHRLPW